MRRSEFMLGGADTKCLKACQAMESRVRCCRPDTHWRDIATAMVEAGCGSLPVVDHEKKLIGLVSEFDLLKALKEGQDVKDITAGKIMTNSPISVKEDTLMMEVIEILEDKHLIRVPVVKDSKLVGILTRRDVLLCFLRATAEPPHWI